MWDFVATGEEGTETRVPVKEKKVKSEKNRFLSEVRCNKECRGGRGEGRVGGPNQIHLYKRGLL